MYIKNNKKLLYRNNWIKDCNFQGHVEKKKKSSVMSELVDKIVLKNTRTRNMHRKMTKYAKRIKYKNISTYFAPCGRATVVNSRLGRLDIEDNLIYICVRNDKSLQTKTMLRKIRLNML